MQIRRLNELRPRTVWDIADDAFDLYRERFALFAGIAAVVLVPAYLALTLWVSALTVLSSRPAPDLGALLGVLASGALSLPLFGIAYILYSGATAVAVEARLRDLPAGLVASYRRTLPRLWSLLGASLIVGLLALAGVCTLYVGTVAVFVYYAFVSQAIVLEGRGALESCRRSFELVRGSGPKVLGLLAVLFLLSLLLSLGITLLTTGVSSLLPAAGDAAARQVRDAVIGQAAQSLVSVLLAPLTPIAVTLLYYDLRVRREGLDIEMQAEAIGYPLAPDPFGGVSNRKAPAAARSSSAPQGQEP